MHAAPSQFSFSGTIQAMQSMQIEQAVFTSARTQRARGYQVAAVSPGVRPEDAQQLAVWGPSHGSLRGGGEDASSINFHPLPSGAWCVSKTENAGAEYSGRGGLRIYTQCLIVPREALARFANQPFAFCWQVARAQRLLGVCNPLPAALASFELSGRADPADEGLLADFADRLGPRRLAWLVQGVLGAESLIVLCRQNAEWLASGLLNCLPVECRPDLSCTTGLVHSQRRPFRFHVMSADAAEKRQLQRQPGLTVLDLDGEPPADFAPAGWGAYLAEAAQRDRLECVAAKLREPRPGLRPDGLSRLADELSSALDEPANAPRKLSDSPGDAANADPTDGLDFVDAFRRSHAAHQRFGEKPQPARPERSAGSAPKPTAAPKMAAIATPSELLTTTSHSLLEKLERLDDLVFDTINGRRPALEELAQLWPRMLAELPPELLHESREQYLRYAVKLWDLCMADGVRDPKWAVAALDVLCVLFDEKS